MFQTILLLLGLLEAKNYAILVNTSKDYKNYRHSADIQVVHNVLRDNGYAPDDILVLFREDQIQNRRNPFPNAVCIGGNTDTPYTGFDTVPLDLD